MKLKFSIVLLFFSLFQVLALDMERSGDLLYFPSSGVLKKKIDKVVINPAFTEITNLHEKLGHQKIHAEEIVFQVQLAIGGYFNYLQTYNFSEEKLIPLSGLLRKKERNS